jgi:hypothetical protein
MRAANVFLFATTALAATLSRRSDASDSSYKYLTPAAAEQVVSQYSQLIGNYSDALAESFLADSFTDTSDSINVLTNAPLGSVTFPSKQVFMSVQAGQPKTPLVVQSVNAVTSDTIVLRWTQTFGAANQPVAGISILVVEWNNGVWQLKTIYTEFNSLTYFTNIGGSVTPPPS